MGPAPQQKRGVRFLLFAPHLFPLIHSPLTRAESFQRFPFLHRPPIDSGRFLPNGLKAANLFLDPDTQLPQLLPKQYGKVKFGRHPPPGEQAGILFGGLIEYAVKPAKRFLRAHHIHGSALQRDCPLALQALPQAKNWLERKVKGHTGQTGSAINRARESLIPATPSVDCIRNSRSAGMSAIARSRSGSPPF